MTGLWIIYISTYELSLLIKEVRAIAIRTLEAMLCVTLRIEWGCVLCMCSAYCLDVCAFLLISALLIVNTSISECCSTSAIIICHILSL